MRRTHLLVVLVGLLPARAFTLAAQGEDLVEKSRRGKELMAAGRYSEALPVYRELVQAVPGNPGLLLNLGMALHLAGLDEEALPHLQAAQRLQPDSPPAALSLALAELRLGRAADALVPLQKAVDLQPDSVDGRSALAEAFLGLERYDEAERRLEKLSRLAPKDPATWFNLGRTYEELARRASEDLTKRSPESAFALALEADGLVKQERTEAAFHLYRRALERDPTFRGLHAAVAAIYKSTGHVDWAAVEEERERVLPRPSCARDTLECAFSAGKHQDVVAAASRAQTPKACYW